MSQFRTTTIESFALLVMLSASGLLGHASQITGTVQSGPDPIVSSIVTLHAGGVLSDSILATAQADPNGFFSISYTAPTDPAAVLYLIADGGSTSSPSMGSRSLPEPAIKLATILGAGSIPAAVVINERTTVAAAYAMAQFISGDRIAGRSPGLQNAAATFKNLADPSTGEVGSVLANPPNGLETWTMREFNSLANLLAGCVNASGPATCKRLFELATPPGGTAPSDTLAATVNIAHYPWQNPAQLFQLSQNLTLYRPGLLLAPDAWTLAIRYDGNGMELDGPGNMAVDKDGNVWSTNNYVYNASPFVSVCGGQQLIKLTPTGSDAPGAPYRGGGLYGAGFGIAIDPSENVWVGNFGFIGQNCTDHFDLLDKSVSEFSPDGTPLSGPHGFRAGYINQPQGTASDQQGNIWIANCGNDSVTQYPGGNPDLSTNFNNLGLSHPFGLAIDGAGNAWLSSNGNDKVVGIAPGGTPLGSFSGAGIKAPLGVAVDSLGNVWVANSGVVELPCGGSPGELTTGVFSITEINRAGKPPKLAKFTGGGLRIPWGIAVDGNDNIWVANFGGQRLSQFCGARPSQCPPGFRTGDPISPRSGYTSDGLTRNTGVVIDPSGNVWVANNWEILPIQTNPGGHHLVVFVGLAAPVKTPMIGPPQRP